MRIKLFAFTLLEIILVLAILSTAASVIGWQISKCVHIYAFNQEIEEIYNTLKRSQILCLTYQTDIDMHFFYEKGILYYQLQTQEPFAENFLDQEKKKCTEVSKISYNGKVVKKWDLSLISHGNIEPRGFLGFFPKKAGDEAALWFDFQGGFLLSKLQRKPLVLKEKSPAFPEEQLKKHLSRDIMSGEIKK